MCYVPCAMCYVICAMCYVICAMCYVLCAMCYHYCVVSTCISQTQFLFSIYSLCYISKISQSEILSQIINSRPFQMPM